ncbi:MAG: LapA family protein [Anaerolineae bacterium]
MPLVGWILIIMAAGSVIGVLFMVMREHVETEEYYVPPSGGEGDAKDST